MPFACLVYVSARIEPLKLVLKFYWVRKSFAFRCFYGCVSTVTNPYRLLHRVL